MEVHFIELPKFDEELEYLGENEKIDALENAEQKGIEQGIRQGKEEGAREEKIEIARNAIKTGLDIRTISTLTELTVDEIERLK
ncbi:MAG: hypothetical protein SOY04_12315 [Clostridium celatum]|nr:hypothetical protein [Clostridium celatum]